jgi:hypothetical protein
VSRQVRHFGCAAELCEHFLPLSSASIRH